MYPFISILFLGLTSYMSRFIFSQMIETEVCIIGGGFSGLGTALKLSEHGYQVIVVEKENILGGLAKSFFYKNKWIPETYHHLNEREDSILEYINKFGFKKYLVWKNVKTGFWYDTKSYSLTNPWDILGFKPLNIRSRINLLKLGLYIYLRKDYRDLSKIPAEKWLAKLADKYLIQIIFQNLAQIKYNSLQEISAAWLGEMLHEAARIRGTYAYLSCGLQSFINKFGTEIVKNHGKVVLNTEVVKIHGSKVFVINNRTHKKEIIKAKVIISSIAPPLLNKISVTKYAVLSPIKYTPVTCICFGTLEDISEYYWNIFIKPKSLFNGFFKYTQLNKEGGTKGEHVYYFFTYHKNQQDVQLHSNHYIKEVNKIVNFKPLWIHSKHIPFSTPTFLNGYSNPPIQLSQSLFLTGIYREYPSPRTMNVALKSGLETTNYILSKRIVKNKYL